MTNFGRTDMEKKVTVIPDVHGRPFWRRAAEAVAPGTKIVFLGDYLDPYPQDGVSPEEATRMLEEIIELKRCRHDNVTLLLGNHDLGYLDPDINFCRRDYRGAWRNRRILEDNLGFFRIAHEEMLGGTRILFTHAGVAVSWADRHESILGDPFEPEKLNAMLLDHRHRPELMRILADAPHIRGGNLPSGSPVWEDLEDYLHGERLLQGWFHVFGHTATGDFPVRVGADGVCLDCSRAFLLSGGDLPAVEPAC